MKNKKCILVFVLMIAFLLVTATFSSATNDNPLEIIRDNNTTSNNQTNTGANNEQNLAPITSTNNTNNNNAANNTLPKTGVAEDTTLVVFIAVCVVSAVYAFVKIRNYKNV